MNKTDKITAAFFDQMASTGVSARVFKELNTSQTIWMACGRIALQKNDHQALDLLDQCEKTKDFWHLLTENICGDEHLFLQTLNRCPKTNLRPHENICAQQVGCSLMEQNKSSLFFALFDYCEHPPHLIKKWTSTSIYMCRMEISEFLIPLSQSAHCSMWLSESILSDFPSLEHLVNHMQAPDIGRACGMIAHVERKRDTIVKILNSKPESWNDFCAYNNDIALQWIQAAYAEHQKNLLQRHVFANNFSSRKSKI